MSDGKKCLAKNGAYTCSLYEHEGDHAAYSIGSTPDFVWPGASLPSGTPAWSGAWNNWIAPFSACPRCGGSLNWTQREDALERPLVSASCCEVSFAAPLSWHPATPPSPTTPAPRCRECEAANQPCGHYRVREFEAAALARPAAPGDEGDARCGAIQNHLTCTLPDGHAGDYHEDFDHGREWSVACPAAPLGEPDKAWRDGWRSSAEHLAELIFNATYSPPQSPERRAAQQLVNAARGLLAHLMGCDECGAGHYCDEGEMYGGVVTHDYLTRITESNGCRADAVRARIAGYRATLAPTPEVKDA